MSLFILKGIGISRRVLFAKILSKKSDTPYHCPWKGDCQYFNVGEAGHNSKDSAWSYPNPIDSAIESVRQDFSNYIAFWRDVKVTE
jgi:uncharacterized protein (DUF427 family)